MTELEKDIVFIIEQEVGAYVLSRELCLQIARRLIKEVFEQWS